MKRMKKAKINYENEQNKKEMWVNRREVKSQRNSEEGKAEEEEVTKQQKEEYHVNVLNDLSVG